MSTTETKQQTPTPAEIPFTTPQAMVRYVTDTGKILPRKYTHLSAKHQPEYCFNELLMFYQGRDTENWVKEIEETNLD